MTTPDQPVGGSAGAGPAQPEEGVVRVFPGPPPPEPELVAPVPPVGGYDEPPLTHGAAQPPRPTPSPYPTTPPPSGPPSAGDEAKSAAGDVKDQAASSASDVKDTAAQQASAVAGTAQQQAAQVKDTAANAASDVASTAREQAQNVVGEASQQARQIADSLTSQLNEQAGTQQQRAAGSLRELAQGVSDMAEGKGAPSGPLGDYTRQAADRLHSVAGYLESKQPGEIVSDARSFAARRPAAFLVGAAIAGFAVGRLVKGARSDSGPGSGNSSSSGSSTATGSSSSPQGGQSTGTGFGAPTAFPPAPTPAPGYTDRIPTETVFTEPVADEPYPSDLSRPTPGVTHGDPLAEDVSGIYPGTPGVGGERGV